MQVHDKNNSAFFTDIYKEFSDIPQIKEYRKNEQINCTWHLNIPNSSSEETPCQSVPPIKLEINDVPEFAPNNDLKYEDESNGLFEEDKFRSSVSDSSDQGTNSAIIAPNNSTAESVSSDVST